MPSPSPWASTRGNADTVDIEKAGVDSGDAGRGAQPDGTRRVVARVCIVYHAGEADMTVLWIARRALWRYGGLVPVITAGVGFVTPTTEAHKLALFALLYLPCALALATLDARRTREASVVKGGAAWR